MKNIKITIYASVNKKGISKAGREYSFYETQAMIQLDPSSAPVVGKITLRENYLPGEYYAQIEPRADRYTNITFVVVSLIPIVAK